MQNENSMNLIDQTTTLPQSMPDTTDDEAALEMAALAAIFAAETTDEEQPAEAETETAEAADAAPVDTAAEAEDAPVAETEEACSAEEPAAEEAPAAPCCCCEEEPAAEVAEEVISDAPAADEEAAAEETPAEEAAAEGVICDDGAAEAADEEFDEDEEFCPVIIPAEFDEDDEYVSVAIADDIDDYDSNDRTEEDYVRTNATRVLAQKEMEARASAVTEKKKEGFFDAIKNYINFHKQFFTILAFVLVIVAFLLYTRLS